MNMFKIGPFTFSSPYVLAPMAGVSQMPFRRLALKLGAGLAPTELVSAKGLFYESVRTKTYLTYDQEIEKPFCVQLFGGEVESMAVAAEKALAMGADIIDINMGCPVKKVTKINAGSALLCDHARASAIVSAMLKATNYKIPITAKIRSGWDHQQQNFLEVGRVLEEAGISALALHARTRAQGYSGQANWDHIASLKAHLKIPVIGNGDVVSVADAHKMMRTTQCDAVMIGRAALGNPWLFKKLIANDDDLVVTAHERWMLVKEHLAEHIKLNYKIAVANQIRDNEMMAIKSFRSHLIWYSKGLKGSASFRQKIMTTDCVLQTNDLLDEFFSEAQTLSSTAMANDDDAIDYRQAFG